jgi:sn-glycerol 3-phosphate transport system ATP-binding protein
LTGFRAQAIAKRLAIVFRVSGCSRVVIDTELVIAASADSLHFFDSVGNRKDRRR